MGVVYLDLSVEYLLNILQIPFSSSSSQDKYEYLHGHISFDEINDSHLS